MLDDIVRQYAVDCAEEIAKDRKEEVDGNLEAHDKKTEAELREDFAPGSLGFHELLDRASLVMGFWFDYIHSHPGCITDPALFEKAHLIGQLLYSFYNNVGGKWAGLPELSEEDKAAMASLPNDLVEKLLARHDLVEELRKGNEKDGRRTTIF